MNTVTRTETMGVRGETTLHRLAALNAPMNFDDVDGQVARRRANLVDRDGRTPLMYAASSGSLDAVRALLCVGARVNEQDATGKTALAMAAANGDSDVVDLLLAARAKHHRDDDWRTPLIAAAENGHAECVASLLSSNASPLDQNAQGVCAIHLTYNVAAFRRLLYAVRSPYDYGDLRPLVERAIRLRCVRSFGYLLAHGADACVPLVVHSNFVEALEMCLDSGVDAAPHLIRAVKSQKLDCVEALTARLRRGEYAARAHAEGGANALFHAASAIGEASVARRPLAVAVFDAILTVVDPHDAMNDDLHTPLMKAIECKSPLAFEHLLPISGALAERDLRGRSAAHYAAADARFVDALKNNEIWFIDDGGWTPLAYAIVYDCVETMDRLWKTCVYTEHRLNKRYPPGDDHSVDTVTIGAWATHHRAKKCATEIADRTQRRVADECATTCRFCVAGVQL